MGCGLFCFVFDAKIFMERCVGKERMAGLLFTIPVKSITTTGQAQWRGLDRLSGIIQKHHPHR